MNKRRFIQLLRKYRQGTATPEERRFIESYYNLFEAAPEASAPGEEEKEQLKHNILNEIWEEVWRQESGSKKATVKRMIVRRVQVAAAVLVLLAAGLGMYRFIRPGNADKKAIAVHAAKPHVEEIHPGGNKAVLTLANGQKVVLDSLLSGTLVQQGMVNIRKQDSGELVYQGLPGDRRHTMAYNTISTPRGGEYRIVLADGTKVWLNAESSLHYPVEFNSNERRVTLSGEAYFEVAKQITAPFIVQAGASSDGDEGMEVKVLGTSFDISAYREEETISTTLAEGAIRISKGRESRLLKPGDQASLNRQTGNIAVKPVDTDIALAWKEGLFHFEKNNIVTIMRQVARWYNVEVVYATKELEPKNFSGIMSRYGDVEAVLKRLELTGAVHFQIDGTKIIVKD